MTIVMCIVFVTTALITACGQERLGSHFELVERAGAQTNIDREKMELGKAPVGDSIKVREDGANAENGHLEYYSS